MNRAARSRNPAWEIWQTNPHAASPPRRRRSPPPAARSSPGFRSTCPSFPPSFSRCPGTRSCAGRARRHASRLLRHSAVSLAPCSHTPSPYFPLPAAHPCPFARKPSGPFRFSGPRPRHTLRCPIHIFQSGRSPQSPSSSIGRQPVRTSLFLPSIIPDARVNACRFPPSR